MELFLPSKIIDQSHDISLGDLFGITNQDKNIYGILRIISYSKGHLMMKPNKTSEEKNLLLDLIELVNEIGPELFDKAFAVQRERLAAKENSPRLPLPRRTLNPVRRKAEVVRLEKRAK